MKYSLLLCLLAPWSVGGGEVQRAGEGYAGGDFAALSARAHQTATEDERLEEEGQAALLEQLEEQPGIFGRLWLSISEGITSVSTRVAEGGKYLGRGLHITSE